MREGSWEREGISLCSVGSVYELTVSNSAGANGGFVKCPKPHLVLFSIASDFLFNSQNHLGHDGEGAASKSAT